jgi:hypothetical protein
MLNDLLALSEGDEDAKAVVEKYRIQRQNKQSEGESTESEADSTPAP